MGRHFLWDPVEDNIVKEVDDGGNTIADYTTEPTRHGSVISQHRNGESRFFHFDGQGNTTSLTDENGNVTDTYAYNAFGDVTARTGTTVNPFQYAGAFGVRIGTISEDYVFANGVYSGSRGRWLNLVPLGSYVVSGNSLNGLAVFAEGEIERNASLYPFLPGIKITKASIDPCVTAIFQVKFKIPPYDLVQTGFVLQEIRATYDIVDCVGNDVTVEKMGVRGYHYWEAFDIDAMRTRGVAPDDGFEFVPDLHGTRGIHTTKGLAKGAGNVPIPPDMYPPVDKNHPARELPITVTKPAGWDMFPGTEHDWTIKWDCCCTPHCVTMHTVPPWAIDLTVGPGASPECPIQIPNYEDI